MDADGGIDFDRLLDVQPGELVELFGAIREALSGVEEGGPPPAWQHSAGTSALAKCGVVVGYRLVIRRNQAQRSRLLDNERQQPPKNWERRLVDGRWMIFVPFHPRAQDGWVYEHRLVVECQIGARLPAQIQVHHRDERAENNSVENLLLCPDEAVHRKIHDMLREGNAKGREESEAFCRDYRQDLEEDLELALGQCFEPKNRTGSLRRTRSDLAEILRALPDDVQQRLLNLAAPPISARASPAMKAYPRSFVDWSNEEEAVLRYLAKRLTDIQIAQVLRRSPEKITSKLDSLPMARDAANDRVKVGDG